MANSQVGLIGLAVMGQNLALNIHDHGYKISVYNRTSSKTENFMKASAKDTAIHACFTLEEFVQSIETPRKIILMVKAGEVVDAYIEQLKPLLSAGDIIIDGGNSLYTDTIRRVQTLAQQQLIFMGVGISGGEEGARFGPSIMPGGNKQGWPLVKDMLQDISAKVNGQPCCDWIGEEGAGHYVKMVHNGIEYGDMQLICEAYQFMREGLDLSVDEIADIFQQWNEGALNSYLIEITTDILRVKDADGLPLVDKILDSAGQKGTGKWTAINALELGVPLTLISEAVFSRFLSSLVDERARASTELKLVSKVTNFDKVEYIQAVHDALFAAKIISYTQGYLLMHQAAKEYNWILNYAGIAKLWRGGCIIRSQFLDNISSAYESNAKLDSLLMDKFFQNIMNDCQLGWRKIICKAVELGIPTPGFATALSFYDGYRSKRLPANLLQAQRDYFGAHTFERVDKARGEYFHHHWQ
ncbi:MAG: decarboxylating NADP(+)-dependent phosphogluconate dehydrogenase [Pseudomonadota bacterium]